MSAPRHHRGGTQPAFGWALALLAVLALAGAAALAVAIA